MKELIKTIDIKRPEQFDKLMTNSIDSVELENRKNKQKEIIAIKKEEIEKLYRDIERREIMIKEIDNYWTPIIEYITYLEGLEAKLKQ